MTSAFEQVDIDASCLSQECEKQGCHVGLVGLARPLHLVDMDHPKSPAKGPRCDYLVIGAEGPNDLYVVALELKTAAFRAEPVSKQLAGGAKAAERVVPKASCRFVPVVVHDGVHRREIDRLAKHRVRYRGQPCTIRLMGCGEYLVDALA